MSCACARAPWQTNVGSEITVRKRNYYGAVFLRFSEHEVQNDYSKKSLCDDHNLRALDDESIFQSVAVKWKLLCLPDSYLKHSYTVVDLEDGVRIRLP